MSGLMLLPLPTNVCFIHYRRNPIYEHALYFMWNEHTKNFVCSIWFLFTNLLKGVWVDLILNWCGSGDEERNQLKGKLVRMSSIGIFQCPTWPYPVIFDNSRGKSPYENAGTGASIGKTLHKMYFNYVANTQAPRYGLEWEEEISGNLVRTQGFARRDGNLNFGWHLKQNCSQSRRNQDSSHVYFLDLILEVRKYRWKN